MKRILMIRGGAIGDFILTLPALKALRDAQPGAQIEILGYKNIAVLAARRFYAQAVRSIEYGPLASFFAKNSELPGDLADYFASFDLIISYLYDPDGIFEMNLRRCGVENLIHGPAKIDNGAAGRRATSTPARSVDEPGGESINHKHAAEQLAHPVEELGISINDFAARLYPSAEDRRVAENFLGDLARPIVALHPGSGSEKKNWPLERWIEVGEYLLGANASSRSGGFQAAVKSNGRLGKRPSLCGSLVIVSGEADEVQVAQLEALWKDERVIFAKNLPLPHLAAVLEQSIFIGHDSGISHLAAAAGANCILLFGPTDPEIWAPRNENAHVIRAPSGEMPLLEFESVRDAIKV